MSDELVVKGIGTIVTGRLEDPIAPGDAIYCRAGRIEAVGRLADVHPGNNVSVLDAAGAVVTPGLIDAHVHPVAGDFTPRHNALGWIENYLNGGVTTLISAGEPHFPGRPRDSSGAKTLAILAARSFANLRPGGAKVHAGALLLEPGLTDEDFAEMAAAGVRMVGEVGISTANDVASAGPLVACARRYGFKVTVHVGGASVPGSAVVGADMVVALQPDVAAHVNGGPTAPSLRDVVRIIDETEASLEVVQAGNIRRLVEVVGELREREALHRLQIGSDTPSGTGVIPLAVLRVLAYVVALGGVEPATAIAAATGLTARRYDLEVGEIAAGRPADLVVLDAPVGSEARDALSSLELGDVPAVAAVVTDGVVRTTRSRVTPPPKRPSVLAAV